jgi:hypothetical protein
MYMLFGNAPLESTAAARLGCGWTVVVASHVVCRVPARPL